MCERTFPDGLGIPSDSDGARACMSVVDNNADAGVTWLHSYVTEDKRKTFCVYDGPSPEAIRQTASRNGLYAEPPIGRFASAEPDSGNVGMHERDDTAQAEVIQREVRIAVFVDPVPHLPDGRGPAIDHGHPRRRRSARPRAGCRRR